MIVLRFFDKFRYLFTGILFAVLCYLFPYTIDDWAWGSKVGLNRLSSWFADYSGRYLSNVITVYLTRSHVVRFLFMAAVLLLILFLMERIIGKKWGFYLSLAFLLLTPKLIFRQTIAWTSGFTNYVFPVALLLLYILYLIPMVRDTGRTLTKKNSLPLSAAFFFLGAATALNVEHVTIYSVVLGIGAILFTLIKYKKILVQCICYAIGALAGTILMFSNSAYHNVAAATDTYRQIGEGGILQNAFRNYIYSIYWNLTQNNLWLNIALVFFALLLFFLAAKNTARNRRMVVLEILCLVLMSLYTAYTLFSVTLIGTEAKTRLLYYGEAAASLLFAAALILYLILIGIELKRIAALLFPALSIVFLTAPLFVVNPIQSRCFFPTYMCFVWLLAELALLFFERTDRRSAASICKKCCALISAAAFIFFLIIYGSIYRADQKRLDDVRKEVEAGAKEIHLPELPYASFTWLPDPETGTIWEKRFKLFHRLPKDITIVTEFVGE